MKIEKNPTNENPIQVLVVDDEPDILRFLSRYLCRKGYQVEISNNPNDALGRIHTNHFDLVLTDFRMPEIDGLTFLKQVKESSPLTEVILMTGFSSVENAVQSMKLGAFDYVVKPFNINELWGILERALRHIQMANDISHFREIDRLKEDFLGNVSHELRTPLTSIQSASKLLVDEFESNGKRLEGPDASKLILMIEKGSVRLSRLLDDLLETFRFNSNKVVLKKVPFSVEKMVKECVIEFLTPCQERGISLKEDSALHLPLLTADPIKVRQALLNLLGNAMKFTPAHGTITIRAEAVDEKSVRISVKDTGMGIAPEHQEKIFDKFYQIDASSTRMHTGMGLGLALVKSIVDAHEGSVTLISFPGKGSTFSMRFPVNGSAEMESRSERIPDPSEEDQP